LPQKQASIRIITFFIFIQLATNLLPQAEMSCDKLVNKQKDDFADENGQKIESMNDSISA
jgi:hypothetical protein